MHRRLAAALTLTATVLLGACTDEAPQPPPPPSSIPKMPSESPIRDASPTPSPDPDEVADAAAMRAYRAQFDEFNRLEMAGGASEPTQKLLDTTSGQLRRAIMIVLRSDKRDGIRSVTPGTLTRVVVTPSHGATRKLTACEDYTHAKWVKKSGTPLKVDQPILNLQHSTAKQESDGKWRIDDTETTHLKTFQKTICDGDQ